MPLLQQPEMQNDQTTHRKSTEAAKRYFGRYFLIFEFLMTVVVYTVLLAIGYSIVIPVLVAAFHTVIYHTVTDLTSLIGSIYSHLCQGLSFLMFHCHVTFIGVFVAVTMIWFVLAVLISFSDHDRLVLLLTINDDEPIVQ